MAEQTLALVRHLYETWNSDGARAIEPFLRDDVELLDAPEMPDARAWHGRRAAVGRLEEVSSAVGGGWADLREFREHGNTVLVSMVWQEDEQADSPAFAEVFHVVRVDGDRIAAIHVFLDRRAAEAAAGV
jgi:ketosteroid isomerase-like protein